MSKEKRTRRQYTNDFKRDAVALVTERGYKISEAARSLGINDKVLRRWKHELSDPADDQTVSDDEKQELKQLRKRVRELEMEKEILKKASVDSIGQCNSYHNKLICCGDSNETNIYRGRERTSF